MARTLFFIEALALAALSLLFPILAENLTAAFILPFALSLILPLACVLSVWPAKEVRAAILLLFSPGEKGSASLETAAILEALGAFSRASAASGFLVSLAIAATRLPLKGDTTTWSWLGLYLALYALVNATLWQALAALAKRLSRPAARGAAIPEDAAARYGLSQREREAAILIAGGRSYKETAAELGISIKTVKTHMGRVYEKTGAASNVALSLLMRSSEAENGANHTKVR
jgi:DNA-binding CsgD family transcriptional regulator